LNVISSIDPAEEESHVVIPPPASALKENPPSTEPPKPSALDDDEEPPDFPFDVKKNFNGAHLLAPLKDRHSKKSSKRNSSKNKRTIDDGKSSAHTMFILYLLTYHL